MEEWGTEVLGDFFKERMVSWKPRKGLKKGGIMRITCHRVIKYREHPLYLALEGGDGSCFPVG